MSLLRFWPRMLIATVLIGLLVWSVNGIQFSTSELISGMHSAVSYMKQMVPPDLSILGSQVWPSLLLTIQMAYVGTVIGFVLALPFGFLAARSTAFNPIVSSSIKIALNVARAVPTIIYAILFVEIVGLGPFPGALGIGVASFVMLAKLFAEALESLQPGPIEAVKAAGGSTLQVFAYGMWPQALPQFISVTLYAWELNLAASFVLGIVGAGGIGQDLLQSIHYFQWRIVSTYMIVIVLLVLIADATSYQIRKRVS